MSSLKALASFVIATSLRRESIRGSGVSANAYSFSESIRLAEPEVSKPKPSITINGYEYTITLDSSTGYINNIDIEDRRYIRSYKLTKPKIFYNIYGIIFQIM